MITAISACVSQKVCSMLKTDAADLKWGDRLEPTTKNIRNTEETTPGIFVGRSAEKICVVREDSRIVRFYEIDFWYKADD